VLKHNGEYYAYGTVPELTILVLHSRDLVSWRPLGDALALHDGAFAALWAPEVAYDNGTFYMYYSAGGEEGEGHQLRVATATRPSGPFEDSGVVLTPDDPFTIDAHPFRDDDGQWYLYYASDRLDGDRVGTSITVDRLLDMTRLAGEPVSVLRASADWQLYEARRQMYGAVHDWHTLEGPFVIKRQGRYWCLYSGGAWTNATYGVSYAVADTPLGPFHEPQPDGPALLRTRPGELIGPGHNSVVRGPDGTDYLVYHAWDVEHTARRMCIDRLDWTPDGPRTAGPTISPQPVPTGAKLKEGSDR
jgi:beta-xylosidase